MYCGRVEALQEKKFFVWNKISRCKQVPKLEISLAYNVIIKKKTFLYHSKFCAITISNKQIFGWRNIFFSTNLTMICNLGQWLSIKNNIYFFQWLQFIRLKTLHSVSNLWKKWIETVKILKIYMVPILHPSKT